MRVRGPLVEGGGRYTILWRQGLVWRSEGEVMIGSDPAMWNFVSAGRPTREIERRTNKEGFSTPIVIR